MSARYCRLRRDGRNWRRSKKSKQKAKRDPGLDLPALPIDLCRLVVVRDKTQSPKRIRELLNDGRTVRFVFQLA